MALRACTENDSTLTHHTVNKQRKNSAPHPLQGKKTGAASAQAAKGGHQSAPRSFGRMKPGMAQWVTYGLGFLAVFAFFTLVYGDVIERAEQSMYISTAPETMQYLLSQPHGQLFYASRWVMLLCKWAPLGAAFLALVMTLTARAFDYAFRIPRALRGIGFAVPVAEMAWMLSRGTNLYYKNEPSLIVLIPLVALAACAVLAALVALVKRCTKTAPAAPAPAALAVRPWGALLALLMVGATAATALKVNENVILTARFPNLADRQDWDTIISEAQKAKRPTRAVAAYYAIALEETDQLLNHMFDIPYDFPKLQLDRYDGSEEYGLFVMDCNFHAGLLNPAYRAAMDHVVMNGPRVFAYKRMALCALLNGETALCRKYLALIDRMPFEHDFVERYSAMADNPKLIDSDAELTHVRSLYPKESKFEQNYQQPSFLGYNVGLGQGSDHTLLTSAAACLYSKDMNAFLMRAQIMHQKGMPFPTCMQEAIAVAALKMPQALEAFPEVGKFVPDEVRAFLIDAKPYVEDREALRQNLKERWLGTYMYYYYTENNDPSQTRKDSEATPGSKAGVN